MVLLLQVRLMQPDTVIKIGAVLILIGIAAGSSLGTLPGLILVFLGLMSRQWEKNILNRVQTGLTLEKNRAFPGDKVEGLIRLINFQPFPIPRLRLFIDWPPELGFPRGREVVLSSETTRYQVVQWFSLRWFERIQRRFSIPCAMRGDYRFGHIEARAGDLFGFSEARASQPVAEQLLIYPRQVPVNLIKTHSRSPFGERSDASWIFEDPILFRGTRDYYPDDPYSRIEWKATARTGKLQTRVVDASFASELGLIVNVATGDFLWQIDRELLEKNLLVVASLLPLALEEKYLFGIYSNGRIAGIKSTAGINVGSGPDHYRQCLEFLARLLPGGRIEGAEALASAGRRLGEKAHLLVFSAIMNPALLEEIRYWRSKGQQVTLIYSGARPEQGYPPGIKGYQVLEGGNWDEIEAISLYPFGS